MQANQLNAQLAAGNIDKPGLFPHLDNLQTLSFVFEIDFGLEALPQEPGILLIRGARQYGKSTWLEKELFTTIKQFGPGTAYYINGEDIPDPRALKEAVTALVSSFSKTAPVRRIFIDEITAVPQWEIVLKRLVDQGALKETLVVTTGSKATDLRRGSEKLPGRKGKLARTNYLFTPVSYEAFYKKCHAVLGTQTLVSYLISGGSPIACAELATHGYIPEYVIELTRDWIEGEVAFEKRSRVTLLNIMQWLYRFGGTPIGQAKLAREAGLANNTIAAGYIELLNDLGCVIPAYPWDPDRNQFILRKPCKYHFTNLLAAVAYHTARIRRVEDFLSLSEEEQAIWYEWLIAQELLRRHAIEGRDILAPLGFWQSKTHEIDFVIDRQHWLEVKRGRASVSDFTWFPRVQPRKFLTVINQSKFETDWLRMITLEEFLLASRQRTVDR